MQVERWKMADGSYAGTIHLVDGQLSYTPFQSMLARFLNDRSLLELPLTRASFGWTWSGQRLTVSDLTCATAGNRFGVRGDLVVSPGANAFRHALDRHAARIRPQDGRPGRRTFSFPATDGLRWARVTLSGTVKKPQAGSRLAGHRAARPSSGGGLLRSGSRASAGTSATGSARKGLAASGEGRRHRGREIGG